IALLGEEGDAGAVDAKCRWVVDPIDGTVNFAYGIPHACVSIALQERSAKGPGSGVRSKKRFTHHASRNTDYVTLVGVVYDPFQNELWKAVRGQRARLNGKPICVSRRGKLAEALVAMGFAKSRENLEKSLPYFNQLARRVLKVRSMGAAALALAYVATGRFDAYIERAISLWDIAAGGLILECAGGEFWREPVPGYLKYRMVANNGLLHDKLPLPQ
ncbi:MAG TPA: inositol monophosphatase family protein, partial [Verrucomicrobiae bacterium]|nr:inositol monophosphatase family protein [Verrucomicrobiae bacterium]